MQSTGQSNYKRKEIIYFDGLNSSVANNIAKKEELQHCENARSPMIGTVEKREGTIQVGSDLTSTQNHGVFNFSNDNNTGLYRSSKVSGINSLYYMKSVSAVAFTGAGLNDATSSGTYTGSAASATFTVIIDTVAASPDTFKWRKNSGAWTTGVAASAGAHLLSDGVSITFAAADGHTLADQWVITTNVWTALAGADLGTGYTPEATDPGIDSCVAEGNLYLVNRGMVSRYVQGSDGTTVISSATTGYAHNLLRAPKASLINYYKGRLYLADFYDGSYRQKNTILRSSVQLGILALANSDAAVGATTLLVTDTKYINTGETIEVRRGGSPITTFIVLSVTETSVTMAALGSAINASDELWVNGTYAGTTPKVFRWVSKSSYSGISAKDYDTFKLSSTTDNDVEEIKMLTNVGNVMIVGSNNNLAVWNDFVLRTIDIGAGCVSKTGQVKCAGSLFFMHYTGVWSTQGEAPTLMSSKVERYITGATKAGLEACVAGKKGRNVFFAIGDVTLRSPDGSIEKILHDVCLEYSIIQQNWYVHTNVKATSMATLLAAHDQDRLVMATTDTTLPITEFLSSGVYTDLGSEIPFRMDSPSMLLGALFERISYPMELVIEMERGASLKAFMSLDMSAWYEIPGEAAKGLTILKIIDKDIANQKPPRCRNIRFSLRHNAKMLCKVSKVAINYMISSEEEVERPDETQPIPNI
ncbi:MAG: hypothetical protein WCX88_01845 [Patescibacteria group bacterium]